VVEKLRNEIQLEFLNRLGIEAEARFVEPRNWGDAGPG
jgi:hypothetical protein